MMHNDIHKALAPWLKRYEQVCVVRTEGVKELKSEGIQELVLSTSESTKSIETVQRIWDFLFAQEMTRHGLLIAVGGGVLTDLAGFAAATYKRGIDYINIPTTLLAMVDASSGGKTGINYHGLKNSIGVFATPVETIIDTHWLTTLPTQELLSGFGEMLKTGLIENTDRFTDRTQNTDRLWDRLMQYDLDTMPLDTLAPLIKQCVAVKEHIVQEDPREEGLRKVLNFGHTIGHALEEISLGTMPHGFAVVYGLIAELYLSVVKMGCPKEPLQQLTQIMLHYYGKPQCKCSDRNQLIAFMQQDKKNERTAQINCTLIRQVGEPVVNQTVTTEEAQEALDYLFSL